MRKRAVGVDKVVVFPEKPKKVPTSASNIRLPVHLWDELSRIAKSEKRSRNEVIKLLLEWACQDYRPAGDVKAQKK